MYIKKCTKKGTFFHARKKNPKIFIKIKIMLF